MLKFKFNIKDYIVTLYNFRIKYNNLFCDLIISNGNVICDFYANGNLINFYDNEKFCIIEMPGEFDDYFAILVPKEYYLNLVDIKKSFSTCFYDEFLVDPYVFS